MSTSRRVSSGLRIFLLGLIFLIGFGALLNGLTGKIISFKVPGAIELTVSAVNSSGTIAGTWQDGQGVHHGFLRDVVTGGITTIDEPDAGHQNSQGTWIQSINDLGETTGFFSNSTLTEGFVRDQFGNFTSFDVPHSSFTNGISINSSGMVAGSYGSVKTLRTYGFGRSAAGVMTIFNVPNATYTVVTSLNSASQIAGYYADDMLLGLHGFIRGATGQFTTFDIPFGTNLHVQAIDDVGGVTGYYEDANLVFHSFFRDGSGQITTFDAPDAGTRSYQGTFAYAVNTSGAITGDYIDENSATHGFVRLPSGTLTTIDDPNGVRGTFPTCINRVGQIAGVFTNSGGIQMGFLRQ